MSLLQAGGIRWPLPVSVLDHADLLVGVDPADGPWEIEDGAHSVPGSPNRIRLQWLGGDCERVASVIVNRSGTGLVITVDSSGVDGPCFLVGHSRAIEIELAQPVDPSQIDVIVDGRPLERTA